MSVLCRLAECFWQNGSCQVSGSLSRAGIMGHTQQQSERELSYGTLCCHRQPVKMLLGDCKSWSQWQNSFWGSYIGAPKAEACMRRRECGRLSSSAHFSPGEEDKLSHTKKWQLWQVFVAVWRILVQFFLLPIQVYKCWKSVSYEKWSKATWFEEIYFIRLGHTTSNIISHREINHSTQDLWSQSSLFNLGNVIHCVHRVRQLRHNWKIRLTECCMSLIMKRRTVQLSAALYVMAEWLIWSWGNRFIIYVLKPLILKGIVHIKCKFCHLLTQPYVFYTRMS